MNTSKEAEKKAAEKAQPKKQNTDSDFDNPDELSEEEKEAMSTPAKNQVNGMDEMFAALESKETLFVEMTANYIDFNEFELGEERPFIFVGKTTFTTKEAEVKPAVTLLDKEGNSWICASTVVVNALFKVEKIPCGCKIKFNGKEKGKNGTYFKVQVFVA